MVLPHHLPPPLGTCRDEAASGDGCAVSPETRVIRLALERTGGNVTAAAAALGISRAMLHRKVRRCGLRQQGANSYTVISKGG
ncbi:hypothetical protein KXR53_19685 [Inquilinus limosus]